MGEWWNSANQNKEGVLLTRASESIALCIFICPLPGIRLMSFPQAHMHHLLDQGHSECSPPDSATCRLPCISGRESRNEKEAFNQFTE